MTRTLLKTLFCLALTACLVGGAFAQTANLEITAANPDGYYLGGIYTNPYTFSITQNGSTTYPVLLSCDDFFNDVYQNESWTANITQLSTIEGETSLNKTVYFPYNSSQAQNLPNNGSTAVQQQQWGYEEIAYLAADLYYNYAKDTNDSLDNYGNAQAAQLSYAIWDIYDPSLLTDNTQHLDSADLTAAENYVAQAQYFVQHGGLVGNALIFTPICNTTTNTGCTTESNIKLSNGSITGAPQEFIEVLSPNGANPMPEPSLIAFLAVDLIFVLALVARGRRHTLTN